MLQLQATVGVVKVSYRNVRWLTQGLLNNRMKRHTQTFRERNKTQRGLESKRTAHEMSDGIESRTTSRDLKWHSKTRVPLRLLA